MVTESGAGIIGVRVSTEDPKEGFTLTRPSGWFDLLVNGGQAVSLQFGRSPFRPQRRRIMVPWNQVSWWTLLVLEEFKLLEFLIFLFMN